VAGSVSATGKVSSIGGVFSGEGFSSSGAASISSNSTVGPFIVGNTDNANLSVVNAAAHRVLLGSGDFAVQYSAATTAGASRTWSDRFTLNVTTGAATFSSSVTANSFVTTGSVRTTNPSDASYFGLFSNDGAMVFDAYGVGAFSSFKVNGTSVLSVDASGVVINGTSRANGYRFAYSTKSSNYTLTDNDDYVVVTNTSTVTLPTAVGRAGKRYVLRSTVGSGVSSSLTTTSGQTIDGIIGPFSFGFGNYNILIVFSDGANWFSETFITGG